MDLITTFQKKREKQAGNGNEPSKPNSVERIVDLQEPTAAIPIDAKPRRLHTQDDYSEKLQFQNERGEKHGFHNSNDLRLR